MHPNPKDILFQTITKIEGAYAPSTIRAYRSNFLRFIDFCAKTECNALPAAPDSVAKYIAALSDGHLCSASIRLAIAAIGSIHQLSRLQDPTTHQDVRIELRRMHRRLGRTSKQATAIKKETLEQMVAQCDKTISGKRNRALLIIAYETLARRSELTSLRLEDLVITPDGTSQILLRRSKTDPEGVGRKLKLSKAATSTLKSWLDTVDASTGPIFRRVSGKRISEEGINPSQVNRIYKKFAAKLELPTAKIAGISGHSMRVGRAQDLLRQGATLPMIMHAGRWSKPDTVMRYIEQA